MKHTTFKSMGTDVEIIIDDSHGETNASILQAIELAKGRMLSLESLLSRFRADSDVSRINSANGDFVEVSSETIEVLHLAEDAYQQTRGFFNPFMGQVLENYGYDVTFADIGSNSNITLSVAPPFIAPMHSPLQIDEGARTVRLEPGYKVDLGGIAKGWIVEQTAKVLERHHVSNFICNAGGDLVCRGSCDGAPWVVGITHPFDSQSSAVNLDVQDMSVATSGTYRRKWSYGGTNVHHIMDPFLGEPVETDIVSCTVLHPQLTKAEILAKVTLILGTAQGLTWLEEQSTNGWVLVTSTGEVKYSCNL